MLKDVYFTPIKDGQISIANGTVWILKGRCDRVSGNNPGVVQASPQAQPPQQLVPELLEAVKLACRKHHLGDESIGWEELSDKLLNVLCETMGDQAFQSWLAQQQEDSSATSV